MTDQTLARLRALLKGYEERTAKLQPAPKTVSEEGDRRRRACGDRLQAVVRPVLQGFATALSQAGHEAWIQDNTASADVYPSVALAFAPRAPDGAALTSQLTFKYDPRRGIAVSRDVKPAAGKGRVVTASTDRIGTMKVEAVTAEWAETKTLSFVEAVLKVN